MNRKHRAPHQKSTANPALRSSSCSWQDIEITVPSDPATWRSRGDECKQLADEETRIVLAQKKERLLADFEFGSSLTLGQATMLELRRGPDEHLKTRVEALATKAGIALGCAKHVPPLKFWLYKLYLYLLKTKSQHLFAGDQTGGIITNVCEASANFCFWLEKQGLEAEFLAKHEGPALTPKLQRGKRCAQIIEEMKRFKFLKLDSGRSLTEIQTENSNFLIWKLRESLSVEDRELFDHPNRWESVVTYTCGCLAKSTPKAG